MLLFPKTTLGTLKAVLVKARDSKRGGLVRRRGGGGREEGGEGRRKEGVGG